MYRAIRKRLDKLEASKPVVEGDYIIIVRNDGSECQLYWLDALQEVLSGKVRAVRPGKLQNGEMLGLCEVMLVDADEET